MRTNVLKKLDGWWKDKRAEFSTEVSQKEKANVLAEIAKNEQPTSILIL